MATLEEIRDAIDDKLDDPSFVSATINSRINEALQIVAGGVMMLDGSISPPLPGLFASDTVTTSTTLPYKALPADYQRAVFQVYDSSDYRVHHVEGGDYYSFGLFMKTAIKKDLSLPGMITIACVKGSNLYYQGIPTATVDLTVQYYRVPATLADNDDVPEGLPAHLAKDILRHYVLKEIFGDLIEDGEDSKGSAAAYHEKKFFEVMLTMIRSMPEGDEEPEFYGSNSGSTYDRDEDW